MATIKSFTSLEQSKKLAEILPLESADYHYIAQGEKSYFYPYSLSNDAVKDYDEEIKYIPCWSLAALIGVIPKPDLVQNSEGTWLVHSWVNAYPWSVGGYSNLVDACVAMAEKLHELNLLYMIGK